MIAIVLLAAGSSRRMGQPKLLLELGGKSLIRRAAEQACAAAVDDVVVVVGPNRQRIEAELRDLPVRLVDNPEHLSGMASSVRAGIRALSPEVAAAIISLADQPFQGSDVFDKLVKTYRASGKHIVVPIYGGQRGNPVLFDRSVFPELQEQVGDQGGREIIVADPSRVATVTFEAEELHRDLDTWDEYLAAKASFETV
jgi:molybdenum cofactor cytidylyltransferase